MTISNRAEKAILFFLLFSISLSLFYICLVSQAPFDSGDGITHYLISRFSWNHPGLFLHHWGKPFFTLLSSPFSQFGLIGMNVFQIVCAMAASYFCYRIAKKLDLKYAWMLPVLICFSPVYFAVINSGLTEICFGSVLMLAVWMIFEKRFVLAAIAVSFLPFVRSEAYVILPLFALLFLFKKQWIGFIFLFFAPVVYSVAGFFYFNDLFWIISQNQSITDEGYTGIDSKGGLFHYLSRYKEITGTMSACLILAGLYALIRETVLFYKNQPGRTRAPFIWEEVFLIYGSCIAVLVLHTFLYWYKGFSYTNLGMLRYMSVLIPPAAIIALRGLNTVLVPLNKFSVISLVSVVVISGFIIVSPFRQNYFPFSPGGEEKVVQSAGKWIADSGIKNSKLYYSQQYLVSVLGVDPFDKKQAQELIYVDKNNFTSRIEDSALVVWDAHYSPNEGRLPLDSLLKNPHFELLQKFSPGKEFFVLGGYPFEVYVFQKNNKRNNQAENDTLHIAPSKEDSIDFEVTAGIMQPEMLSAERSFSGKQSSKSTDKTEFGPGIQKHIHEIADGGALTEVVIQFRLFSEVPVKDLHGVVEIMNSENKQVDWQSKRIADAPRDTSGWQDQELHFFIHPKHTAQENYLKIYIWNQGKNNFYVDDLIIRYITSGKAKTTIVY